MAAAYSTARTTREDATIRRALTILASRLEEPGPSCVGTSAVRDYLRLLLADRQHEVFVALWLDAQNRVIATDEMFKGTLTHTSVFPREVVKQALARNAASVIFAHNHPSGFPEPSQADLMLTAMLGRALSLVDVRMLDHFIVGGLLPPVSLSERGLLGLEELPTPPRQRIQRKKPVATKGAPE